MNDLIRNKILDLLIENLKVTDGICFTLTDLKRDLILHNILKVDLILIKKELSILFDIRDKKGLSYYKSDKTKTGFRKHRYGSYYFRSYDERIKFLKKLKVKL